MKDSPFQFPKEWKDNPWMPFSWLITSLKPTSSSITWQISNKNPTQEITDSNIATWKSAGAHAVHHLWHHSPTEFNVKVSSKKKHWNAYWNGWFLAIDAIWRDTPVLQRNHSTKTIFISNLPISTEDFEIEKCWADATIWVRTIQNCPSNMRSPLSLSKLFSSILSKLKDTKVQSYSSDSTFLQSWGGIQSIHQGAHTHPAYLFIAEYQPTSKKTPTLIIGKGVNFDTGGLSLKKPKQMELMRMDLSGALCAIAILIATAYLQLPQPITVLTPLVDNLLGSHSLLPGSVITLYGGKTIEVVDPDAEGRILLAEASQYASKHYPNHEVILMGTLTGQIDSVGDGLYSALFRDKSSQDKWSEAAEKSQELVWDCPLQKAFIPLLYSNIADYVNSNENMKADMLWCGIFLKQFWTSKMPWSYIDLTGIIETPFEILWNPRTGHGVGVGLVREYLTQK